MFSPTQSQHSSQRVPKHIIHSLQHEQFPSAGRHWHNSCQYNNNNSSSFNNNNKSNKVQIKIKWLLQEGSFRCSNHIYKVRNKIIKNMSHNPIFFYCQGIYLGQKYEGKNLVCKPTFFRYYILLLQRVSNMCKAKWLYVKAD